MAFGSVGKARIASSLVLQIVVLQLARIARVFHRRAELRAAQDAVRSVDGTVTRVHRVLLCHVEYRQMLRPPRHHGNVPESVPSLAAALLVSVFPVIPTLIFIIFGQQGNVFPFEYACGTIALVLPFEIPLLWFALTKQAKFRKHVL